MDHKNTIVNKKRTGFKVVFCSHNEEYFPMLIGNIYSSRPTGQGFLPSVVEVEL